jgi:hypothetical protein
MFVEVAKCDVLIEEMMDGYPSKGAQKGQMAIDDREMETYLC